MGGSEPMTLKKLKGAVLTTPAALRVLTSAIGLGSTVFTSSLYI